MASITCTRRRLRDFMIHFISPLHRYSCHKHASQASKTLSSGQTTNPIVCRFWLLVHRWELKQTSGLNLPPGTRHAVEREEIPKGAARILNAAKVQEEYREKKRKHPEGGSVAEPSAKRRKSEGRNRGEAGSEGKGKLRIQPGESMAHFNRCATMTCDCMG